MEGNLKQNSVLCYADFGSLFLEKHTEIFSDNTGFQEFSFVLWFFSEDEIWRNDRQHNIDYEKKYFEINLITSFQFFM